VYDWMMGYGIGRDGLGNGTMKVMVLGRVFVWALGLGPRTVHILKLEHEAHEGQYRAAACITDTLCIIAILLY
jgi:hypothetical protein